MYTYAVAEATRSSTVLHTENTAADIINHNGRKIGLIKLRRFCQVIHCHKHNLIHHGCKFYSIFVIRHNMVRNETTFAKKNTLKSVRTDMYRYIWVYLSYASFSTMSSAIIRIFYISYFHWNTKRCTPSYRHRPRPWLIIPVDQVQCAVATVDFEILICVVNNKWTFVCQNWHPVSGVEVQYASIKKKEMSPV